MLNKFHILIIILTLGFFAKPTLTYACGTSATKSEKSCCKKSENENDNKKDCCKKSNSQNDKGCDGKCGNSSCHCTASCNSFAVPYFVTFKSKFFPSISKKSLFPRDDNYFSSGFYSIWLPPKIS